MNVACSVALCAVSKNNFTKARTNTHCGKVCNTWVTKVKEILDKNGYSFVFKSVTDNGNKTEPKGIKSLSNKIKKKRGRSVSAEIILSSRRKEGGK